MFLLPLSSQMSHSFALSLRFEGRQEALSALKYMGWVSVWRIGSEVPVLLPDLEDMTGRNGNVVSKQNKPNYSQQTG